MFQFQRSLFRRKFILVYLTGIFVVVFLFHRRSVKFSPYPVDALLRLVKVNSSGLNVCELPRLKLEGHTKVANAVKCKLEFDWGYLKNGKWHLTTQAKTIYKSVQCKYRAISRKDDFNYVYSSYHTLNESQNVPDEVIDVSCEGRDASGRMFTREMLHAQILIKPKRIHKSKQQADIMCERLSVMLLSYDSVSRVSWLLRLKKTTDYMLNTMGFEVLKGFNIIGDGTPACLTPVLTGKIEEELPSTLKTDTNGRYVDDAYPFIWKELNQQGYATLFNEDWPQVGTWTYRLRGMQNETTTHYLRPFQMSLWDRVKANYFAGRDDMCIGARKRHAYNMDLITQFNEAYRNTTTPIFAFHHYGENSHDGNGQLNLIDNELYEYLKYNYEAGNFANTAIFLYGDHGDRFNTDRQAPQGYLEERLPFLSLYLPKRYREQYPKKYENLKKNRDTLLVPFDIHATVRDLTCLDDHTSLRSMSFLSEIPKTRQCEQIGIRDHYCTCIKWQKVENYDVCEKSSAFSVDYINRAVIGTLNECAQLSLDKIVSCQFATQTNGNYIKVQFTTSPNNGVYEANIKTDLKKSNNLVESLHIDSPQDISRLNRYGTDADCTLNLKSKYDIRKFCYCLKSE